ncbi:nischarin related [Anaeramoeba flamelloides]|uniref:Nischarin related n=1 Tax=Anaeramoeba flamelloides TaxID=1746091 RepID=A0AAV7Z5K5_9EUKA|nr:nischarin related [Anaeramoeba flamelloides]
MTNKSRLEQTKKEDAFIQRIHNYLSNNWNDISKGKKVLSLLTNGIGLLTTIWKRGVTLQKPGKKGNVFGFLTVETTKDRSQETFWYLSNVRWLRIEPENNENTIEKKFSISKIFKKIKILEIHHISVGNILDLNRIVPRLHIFSVSHTQIKQFSDIFHLPKKDKTPINSSSLLRSLSCNFNNLTQIDESLTHCINLENLDLSNNKITKITNLKKNFQIKQLNLSSNLINTTENINKNVGPITKLNLGNNQIQKIESICMIFSLVYLDLSNNDLDSFAEVSKLSQLASLQTLIIENNPICCVKNYFQIIISMFIEHETIQKINHQNIRKLKDFKLIKRYLDYEKN